MCHICTCTLDMRTMDLFIYWLLDENYSQINIILRKTKSFFSMILSDGVKWPSHLLLCCEYWIFLLMTCSQQAWSITDNAWVGRSALTFFSLIFRLDSSLLRAGHKSSLSCNSSLRMHFTTPQSLDNPNLGIWQWTWIITASTLTLV